MKPWHINGRYIWIHIEKDFDADNKLTTTLTKLTFK